MSTACETDGISTLFFSDRSAGWLFVFFLDRHVLLGIDNLLNVHKR